MDDQVKNQSDEHPRGVTAAVPGAHTVGSAAPASSATTPDDAGLATVLGELDRAGWTGQLMPLEGGSIRCLTCREQFSADQVDADEVRRLEGASDPADMVIVVPVTCPHCATRGVLVAHYGPDASGEEADVVAALSRTPAMGHGTEAPPGNTA